METNNKQQIKSQSEFYKSIRPEYFSDSVKKSKAILTKELLDFQLNQITTDQKHDQFETLARKLAEKLIVPNLIPQVGPTGGGDGKTDSETYSVSNEILDRWFIPENGWTKDSKWAFAISAKADWKSKVTSDVKSILGTDREYTKIYFITNRKIPSKKKKDTQDQLKKDFNIEVTILDGEWILNEVYKNNLLDVVVDTLNLSDEYRQEVIEHGPNDTKRLKELDELEKKIADTNRYFDVDYQLVEDMLNAAILSRMIDKPKIEIIGRFDRALKEAKKINNPHQLFRIYYQRAWTYINYYDDYDNFFSDFSDFRKIVTQQPTVLSLEFYYTLFNISSGVNKINKNYAEILKPIKKEFIDLLDNCAKDTSMPNLSLVAKTYKLFIDIFDAIYNKQFDLSNEFVSLSDCFKKGMCCFEYPFENIKKIIEIIGKLVPNNKEYDKLIDSVATLAGEKISEIDIGTTLLTRAWQKLNGGFYKESIIYFGKALTKLMTDDTKEELYSCLAGLSLSYSNIGLLWASNNCLFASAKIYADELSKSGKINKRLISSVEALIHNELLIGRIPYLLELCDLYTTLRSVMKTKDKKIPFYTLADNCLSTRLLHIPYEKWHSLFWLPSALKQRGLLMSEDTALFMLGYLDKLNEDCIKDSSNSKSLDEHYNIVFNSSVNKQMIHETKLFDEDNLQLTSLVLGAQIDVEFKKNKSLLIYAETILAYIESFLGTSLIEVIPFTERIVIELVDTVYVATYKVIPTDSSSVMRLCINIDSMKHTTSNDIYGMLSELASHIIAKNFTAKNSLKTLENLFKEEEVQNRQYMVPMHKQNLFDVIGQSPKILFEDYIENIDDLEGFKMKRTENPLFTSTTIEKDTKDMAFDKLEEVKHNEIKVYSVIDVNLWNNAQWTAFGICCTETIPLGIVIAFKDGEFGKKIFSNWINQFGKEDKNNNIRISIIKGISIKNPNFYRVHITKNIPSDKMDDTKAIYISSSRIHEMNPKTSKHLDEIENRYKYLKKYSIIPAKFDENNPNQLIPYFDFAITNKSDLIIKNAWEIGENDWDSAVIQKDDEPIIPLGVEKPPIKKVLALKSQKGN